MAKAQNAMFKKGPAKVQMWWQAKGRPLLPSLLSGRALNWDWLASPKLFVNWLYKNIQ